MNGSKLTHEFINKVVDFCESKNSLGNDNLRLRDTLFLRYAEGLSRDGDISYFDLINRSLELLKQLIREFEEEAGEEINDFSTGWIAYELSCLLSKVYPTIDKMDTFKKLLRPLI